MASGKNSRIEELEGRLAKDPNSKIFAQLAEEYRKGGLLEEAIRTCREGLKKHPNYFSARVALGRALLESEALEEASQEFEKVLAQVPDNILANRFLGESYYRLGRAEEALLKFRTAHTLAPDDEELTQRIFQLEDELRAAEEPPSPPATPTPALDETAFEYSEEPAEAPAATLSASPTEFSPEGEAVFELEDAEPEESPPEERSGPADVHAMAEPPLPPVPEHVAPPPLPPQVGTGGRRTEAETGGGGFYGEDIEETPIWDVSPEPEPEPDPESWSAPSPALAEPAAVLGTGDGSGTAERSGSPVDTALAERYAAQGLLDRALSAYRDLLAARPGDPALRQRVEELRVLVEAAEDRSPGAPSGAAARGGDRRALEETIEKLERWLAAIRKD